MEQLADDLLQRLPRRVQSLRRYTPDLTLERGDFRGEPNDRGNPCRSLVTPFRRCHASPGAPRHMPTWPELYANPVGVQSTPAALADYDKSIVCLPYPPVTGGKSAISSPSLIVVSSRAIS